MFGLVHRVGIWLMSNQSRLQAERNVAIELKRSLSMAGNVCLVRYILVLFMAHWRQFCPVAYLWFCCRKCTDECLVTACFCAVYSIRRSLVLPFNRLHSRFSAVLVLSYFSTRNRKGEVAKFLWCTQV